MTQVYDAWGVTVSSSMPLSLPLAAAGSPTDVEFKIEIARDVPFQRPSLEVVAERLLDGIVVYSICQMPDDSLVARFYNFAEFRLQPGSPRVLSGAVQTGLEEECLGILVSGTMAAFLASEAGAVVLHASVIEAGGHALGFVAHSGGGKTTLATAFCAAGARLVSDDVLVLDKSDRGLPMARRGTTSLRLRQGAAQLVDQFPEVPKVELTADERLDLKPELMSEVAAPLSALVLIESRSGSTLAVRTIPPAQATVALLQHLRIEGWRHHAMLSRNFSAIAEISACVPVLALTTPADAPLDASFVSSVADACGFRLG